jgi:predicted nucleic-acid-binding protein
VDVEQSHDESRSFIGSTDATRGLDVFCMRLRLTEDDHQQAAVARSLFAAGPIWIAKTVLLETSWVLRSLYGLGEPAILDAFRKLLGLKNVHTEDELAVARALALTVHGIEIADALHLSSRPPGAVFASFDRSFIRRAKRAGAAPVSDLSKPTG